MGTRTAVRMNFSNFRNMGREDDGPQAPRLQPEGTIYHILTEAPAIRDYTGSGPFSCMEATVPSVVHKLAQVSPPACRSSTTSFRNGRTEASPTSERPLPMAPRSFFVWSKRTIPSLLARYQGQHGQSEGFSPTLLLSHTSSSSKSPGLISTNSKPLMLRGG